MEWNLGSFRQPIQKVILGLVRYLDVLRRAQSFHGVVTDWAARLAACRRLVVALVA